MRVRGCAVGKMLVAGGVGEAVVTFVGEVIGKSDASTVNVGAGDSLPSSVGVSVAVSVSVGIGNSVGASVGRGVDITVGV